jgi:hypothetical protein
MGEAVLVPKDTVEHGRVLSKFSDHVKKGFGVMVCYQLVVCGELGTDDIIVIAPVKHVTKCIRK